MPFQIKRGGPLAPKYFLLSLNGTPHRALWARLYNSLDVMHVCRLARAVQNASN